jgi:ribonuclease HI
MRTRDLFHPKKGPDPDNPYPCFLCDQGPDNIEHYYSECTLVQEALNEVEKTLHPNCLTPLRANQETHLFLFDFNTPTNNPVNITTLLLIFNWSVWKTVTMIKKGANKNTIIQKITDLVMDKKELILKTHPSKSGRNKRIIQRDRANALINKTPKNQAILYTDGSANPNPGPSGAGALLIIPGVGEFQIYESLGHGTNNRGEAWAIGMALQKLEDLGLSDLLEITICSDSQWAIGCLRDGHKIKKNKDIINPLKRIIKSKSYKINWIWTVGHAGIRGNEIADRLADKGTAKNMITPEKKRISPIDDYFSYKEV